MIEKSQFALLFIIVLIVIAVGFVIGLLCCVAIILFRLSLSIQFWLAVIAIVLWVKF